MADPDRLDYLIAGYVGETLTDAEGRELATIARRDAAARAQLVDQLVVHRLLHVHARSAAASGSGGPGAGAESGTALMARLRARSEIGREETITDSFRRPAAKASLELPVVSSRRWWWAAAAVAAAAALAAAVIVGLRR